MKRIAIMSEIECSTLMAKICNIPILNFAGFKCASHIQQYRKAQQEEKVKAYACLRFWYIFAMAYLITVMMIQASLIYLAAEEDLGYLIGIAAPVGIFSIGGTLFLHSAFTAFTKTINEEDVKELSQMPALDFDRSKEVHREPGDGVELHLPP
eukprot:TRINITY_DN603_c0_g2_i5.p1 TRINITY_DN603_c0_g2~~TRINITY_DN603_c0_g2_i5.p1  ORF type:complete len:153 (+),score=30.51 TRINITY_DN603_c0_g2_i5:156-614(+)